MNVSAKDMRGALDEMDVITFDMDDLDEEENTQAQQDFQEILEQDKPLLSALWLGVQRMGAAKERGLQIQYLMFNLQNHGDSPYSQDEVEQTPDRWTNYRPGHDIDTKRLGKLFGQE